MVHLIDMLVLGHVVDHLNDGCEVGRTVEVYVLQCIFVCFNDTLKAIDLRIKDVTIECEAVGSAVS